MALKKEIKLANGVTVVYHNLAIIKSIRNGEVRFDANSYVSEETYKSCREPINTETELFRIDDVRGKPIEEVGYEWMKRLVQFEGAEDN